MPGSERLNSEKSREESVFIEAFPWEKAQGYPTVLTYGFRPFFLLAPAYLVLSIVLWSAYWTGLLPLSLFDNPLQWHLYEMLFGVTSAMMIGFILTAVPELYEGEPPVVGKTLLGLVLLWLLGRISFWLMDWLGEWWVALTNIPLLLWVVVLVAKPILADPLRRQLSLAILFVAISGIQIWFFAAMLEWVDTEPMSILKASIGAFMILVLLAARRVNTEAINRWLDQHDVDATYLARPPRYNLAIFSVLVFTLVEFFYPQNSALSWLALAAMAAVLNTLNDFFLDEDPIFIRPFIWPLFMLLVMMATGYGMMGWDYLQDDVYQLNSFRHILTMGALGMAYYMVLVIVSHLHSGRTFIDSRWVGFGAFLLIAGSLLRGLGPLLWPDYYSLVIGLSAMLWVLPFIGFLTIYGKWLLKPRADGLPG